MNLPMTYLYTSNYDVLLLIVVMSWTNPILGLVFLRPMVCCPSPIITIIADRHIYYNVWCDTVVELAVVGGQVLFPTLYMPPSCPSLLIPACFEHVCAQHDESSSFHPQDVHTTVVTYRYYIGKNTLFTVHSYTAVTIDSYLTSVNEVYTNRIYWLL